MYLIIIIFILIILTFVSIFFYYIQNKPIFLNTLKANDFLVTDYFAKNYLTLFTNNKFILKAKTDGGKTIRDYLQLLLNWDDDKKNILTRAVLWINTKSQLVVNEFKWKFILISDRLEMGMPFTLGDVILIPEKLFKIPFKSLIQILCHEQHHVLQRQYKNQFKYFISKHLKFRQVPIINLPKNQFINPDGLQVSKKAYIIKIKKDWYCPLLILTNDGLQKILYRVDLNNSRLLDKTIPFDSLKTLFPTCPSSQLYHPNEILAELGAKYMLDKSSGDINIDTFFKNLSIPYF